MLAIKLKPIGKKDQRTFRIVVTEKKSKLRGRYVEDLGFFNPHANKFTLNNERALFWMKNGARPTDSIHNILIRSGAIKGKKIAVHSKSKKAAPAEATVAKSPVAPAQPEQSAPAEAIPETSEPTPEPQPES